MTAQPGIESNLHQLGQLSPGGYYIGLHIRLAAPLMTFAAYPQDWIDYYTQNAFALRDPTIAWGFSKEGAVRWSEMGIPDPFGIMTKAAEYGLVHGVTVACGPISSRTIGSVARADREFDDAETRLVAKIMQRLHDQTEPPESLTKAQIEALRLTAAGLRYAAAAGKLKISESAFKARLLSARQRLGARTIAEAIQRAKDFRLL